MPSKKPFDYQAKVYSRYLIRKNDLTFGGILHLQRCLRFLKGVKKGAKVLDVGCGAGGLTKSIKFYRPDLKIWGVDISGKAIKEAIKDTRKINFQVAEAEKLPFKDGFFDVVLMFEVLEHVRNPHLVLEEISRVLKKGGFFYLAAPLDKSLWTLHGWLYKFFKIHVGQRKAGHRQRFNLASLRRILKKNSFTPQDLSYSDHYFWQLTDLFYMIYLLLTNQQAPAFSQSLKKRKKIVRFLFFALMRVSALLANLESSFLFWFPGLDAQLTSQKSK